MFKFLFKKEMCPVCKKRCITISKKFQLLNILKDNRCPNCGHSLKLSGKMALIGKITLFAVPVLWILSFGFNTNMSYKILKITSICAALCITIIFIPFSKVERYDSTPMDDLINNTKKVKFYILNFFKRK